MNYEETAIQFLATEENLAMALEIADLVNIMKARFHHEFWQGLHGNLSQKLAQSNKSGKWRVGFNSSSIDKHERDWFACRLAPLDIENGQHYFMVELQQGSLASGYPLRYSLVRSDPNNRQKETGLEEISRLAKSIQSEGLRDDGGWLFGFKYTDYACKNELFLLRMANEKEIFIEEMAQTIWSFFETYYSLIEDAHKVLALVK